MEFIGLAKGFEEQEKFAVVLRGILEHADPPFFAQHKVAIEAAQGNPIALIALMNAIFRQSVAAVKFLENNNSAREADPPRNSAAADAMRKSLAQQFPAFFLTRERLLGSFADFVQSFPTDQELGTFCQRLLNSFKTSVEQAGSSMEPFEALFFVVILNSFSYVDGKLVLNPYMPLYLCQCIADRGSAADFYGTINWINILPQDAFYRLIHRGMRPSMRPDPRAINIGNDLARVTSFPIMPDEWGLNGWNTTQLAQAAGRQTTFGGAGHANSSQLPLDPFPIFRGAKPLPRGSSSVEGNKAVDEAFGVAACGGSASGLSSARIAQLLKSNGLDQIGSFFAAILADPDAEPVITRALTAIKNSTPHRTAGDNRRGRKSLQ